MFSLKGIMICMLTALLSGFCVSGQPSGRSVQNFNAGWKFMQGDVRNGQVSNYDDSGWREIDLPHDWSIEGRFSSDNYSCTAYLPGGIGWYRKSFILPGNERGRKIFICFEGVYNNSEVWINGNYLGKRPNGYISFQYDLTPYVNFDSPNLIAVKVDHSLYGDSRWYTGSGIYRNVFLVTEEPVHIKQWGVYCTTPEVSRDRAVLSADITVVNESNDRVQVKVGGTLKYGNAVTGKAARMVSVDPAGEAEVTLLFNVDNPELWAPDSPRLYSLITEVTGRELLDNVTTSVGFRTLRFDPDSGFFINGRNIKLRGICMHQDAGALGSAVPEEEWSRRLDILKEMGCNAIRTSHNPFSPEFLDLCDSKGFLVIGEAFDEWELPKKKWLKGWNVGTPGKEGYAVNFREWGTTDLRDFILRDRNHPSVIMWSIGNEIDYPDDPYTHKILDTEYNPQTWARYRPDLPSADRLGVVARELAAVVKKLDKTRPVTAGLASALMSNVTGYADALDVAGYNYQEYRYNEDHKKYPGRPLYGSENGMTLDMWKAVTDNNFIMGQFIWTGFEYLGEAGRFPLRSNTAGVIDLAGNKKPEFYFRQSLWCSKPMVFIGTTEKTDHTGSVNLWSHKQAVPEWNYDDGKTTEVSAFSNCEEVELFLNNKSLGRKRMSENNIRILKWEVPFEAGSLKAVGRINGKDTATCELVTTGSPVKLRAVCDKDSAKAGTGHIIHIFVTLCDKNGNTVYSAENEITCNINGEARLLGMEDSNPENIENYKDNRQHAFHGKLLIYLKTPDKPGRISVMLASPGLESVEVPVRITR